MTDQGDAIANLTHHQNITDALLNTMGECMAVQQALLHIPLYGDKNMPLKTFLQDVENGLAIRPNGIQNAFFKGVIAKLRDVARQAVSGVEINNMIQLREALKSHFAPKKTYSQYCAELQGVRMRKGETVMTYYIRIQHIYDSAKASIKEKFTEEQTPNMLTMLGGIALESFKRGLSDELLYALSVKEPDTLANAVKIAQRIEADMLGVSDRVTTINLTGTASPTETTPTKQVHFSEETAVTQAPWRGRSPELWQGDRPNARGNGGPAQEHPRANTPGRNN